MALEPCVATILRTLSVATLNALCTAAIAQKEVANARITKLLINRTQVQLQTIKLEPVQQLYESALAPIQQGLSFYPTGIARLVDTCAQFGEFLTAPSEIIASLKATADSLLYWVREYTAIADDINEEIERLNNVTTLLTDFCDLIDIIVVELTTPAG